MRSLKREFPQKPTNLIEKAPKTTKMPLQIAS